MGLDSPLGCNIASMAVSKEKLEVVRQHIADLNSTLSSGWKAVKKVHVTPQVPLNGSFSRQSLAYLQAAARYLKQVSKAVKTEIVTSHTEPQTYETVQGIALYFGHYSSSYVGYRYLILFVFRNIFMFIEVEELC